MPKWYLPFLLMVVTPVTVAVVITLWLFYVSGMRPLPGAAIVFVSCGNIAFGCVLAIDYGIREGSG